MTKYDDYNDCVPFVAYVETVKALQNANKRMLAIIITLALLLALSNAWWFNYERQFSEETWTYETVDEPEQSFTVESGDNNDASR